MTDARTLHAKLADITAETGWIGKDGHNTFQNYDYMSAEAVLAAIRKPLSVRKIALMPSVTAISEREYQTSKGKASVITTAHVSFEFVDGESGETHVCPWAGAGDDPGDKGLGKAYTNAVKTFLRTQFLIPQGNDPEGDTDADERSRDRQQAPADNGDVPKFASESDVREMVEASKGLAPPQVKLALTAAGVSGVTVWNKVPADKVVAVIGALGRSEREVTA